MNEQNRDTLLLAAAGLGALFATRAAVRRWREYNLRGRTVLITGGSRGLGLLMAHELVAEKARVAICARDYAELERARGELTAGGGQVLAVPCDVSSKEHVDQMVREVRNRWGSIDVLINNAGIIQVGPMEEMRLEDYTEAMNINFWGTVHTTLAVLPEMRRRREGRIVNIASLGGKVAVPHMLPYSASKYAVVGFSEGLRVELAKDNIIVTTVCPGPMRTGSYVNATFKGQNRAEYKWFSRNSSLPVASLKGERAAYQIIRAMKRGDAEIIIPVPANIAAKFHALFPEVTSALLGFVNQALLPAPGGIGKRQAKGKDSGPVEPTPLLAPFGEATARQNNELG